MTERTIIQKCERVKKLFDSFNFLLQVIFQLALTILENNKSRLLSCQEDSEAMVVLNEYLDRIYNPDSPVVRRNHFNSEAGSMRQEETLTVSDV